MIRGLTSGEQDLARQVFGDAVRLATVRILAAPWPINRAFVPGRGFGREWIVWPARTLPTDFAVAPLGPQAVFIHELVHVWQAQQGVNLLWAKLHAGDQRESYVYPVDDACEWCALNIEQQAMVVEHRFRLMRGAAVPATDAFYTRVSPFTRV